MWQQVECFHLNKVTVGKALLLLLLLFCFVFLSYFFVMLTCDTGMRYEPVRGCYSSISVIISYHRVNIRPAPA